ncbi:ArgE/DapE family deacylase [Haloarcula nitratireducens]|uniref:Probable succinyl-diaminopimelate desuccinylase n=1 Tax=Haloarcula nitratireducens TaxID=2487749 RepID=A0AAW4PJ44_9EURY|nr:ArgE/DapE family deacylase [Halomicroarcula nitratireducens]MBX0297491.1 ArgE/DapE family deacylase [Halomicroarcula nitratireducens]
MTIERPIDAEVRQRVRDAAAALTDDAAAFTATLVRERSVQGQEADAQQHVIEKLRALGLEVQLLEATDVPDIEDHPEFAETEYSYDGRPNVVGTKPGASDGRSLLLNGHVDVVPEGDDEQWSFDPFGGEIADGKIHGRGASDMKGGVAAMLFAVEALERAGIELAGDLSIQSVIEEEAGGYGGSLATALDGCDADAVVIPEPTDFDLWIANDGVSYFRVTVEGRGAHAAHTDEGVNAIGKLYPIFQALQDLHDRRKETVHDDLFEREYEYTVSLNPGTLRSGEWPSSVPDEAVLEGRVSHAPSETREEIRTTVEETVREAVAADPWFDEHPPTVEWFGWRGSSASISPDEPIVKTVQDAVSTSLDIDATAKGFPGGIDTRFFVNYADTPALCFGPGAHNIHGTDEFLPVDELEQTITGLALIAMAWCGYEQTDEPSRDEADGTAEVPE